MTPLYLTRTYLTHQHLIDKNTKTPPVYSSCIGGFCQHLWSQKFRCATECACSVSKSHSWKLQIMKSKPYFLPFHNLFLQAEVGSCSGVALQSTFNWYCRSKACDLKAQANEVKHSLLLPPHAFVSHVLLFKFFYPSLYAMSQIKVPATPLLPSYLCLERYNLMLHFYQLAQENAVH